MKETSFSIQGGEVGGLGFDVRWLFVETLAWQGILRNQAGGKVATWFMAGKVVSRKQERFLLEMALGGPEKNPLAGERFTVFLHSKEFEALKKAFGGKSIKHQEELAEWNRKHGSKRRLIEAPRPGGGLCGECAIAWGEVKAYPYAKRNLCIQAGRVYGKRGVTHELMLSVAAEPNDVPTVVAVRLTKKQFGEIVRLLGGQVPVLKGFKEILAKFREKEKRR